MNTIHGQRCSKQTIVLHIPTTIPNDGSKLCVYQPYQEDPHPGIACGQETRNECLLCSGHPALCLGDCFERWHEERNISFIQYLYDVLQAATASESDDDDTLDNMEVMENVPSPAPEEPSASASNSRPDATSSPSPKRSRRSVTKLSYNEFDASDTDFESSSESWEESK